MSGGPAPRIEGGASPTPSAPGGRPPRFGAESCMTERAYPRKLMHVNVYLGAPMSRTDKFTKRAPRVDLKRPALVMDSDGRVSQVTILDVSSGGFRLGITESLRIGEFVTLRVERSDELPAQIRWVLGDEAGGVFLSDAGCEIWGDEGNPQ